MSTIATTPAATPMPAEQRRQIIDTAVNEFVHGGYRLESRSEYQAVFVKGKRPNHLFHLLLTIFTLGLWGIVWIILSVTSHEKRMVVSVDEYGNRRGVW